MNCCERFPSDIPCNSVWWLLQRSRPVTRPTPAPDPDPDPDPDPGPGDPDAPAPIAGQGYSLAYEDEFDTIGPLTYGSDWYSADSTEGQIFVQDSILNLVSRRSEGYPNVTLSQESVDRAFQEGYFESRLRWTGGNGAWPAFWLLSKRHIANPDWPSINSYCAANSLPAAECYSAELDMFEGQGSQPTVLYGTVHRNSAAGYGQSDTQNDNNYNDTGIDLTADFHVYGMLWTPSTIYWYLDGNLISQAPTYDSTAQPMFLLFDMYIGGWTVDTDLTTPDELKLEVDWVRVWQQ